MVRRARKHDGVNSPSHYTQGTIECIDAIESALGPEGFIAFLRGQVIKYNWRLGLKDHPLQEAKKAQWYGNKLAQKLGEAAKKEEKALTRILSEAQTDKKEISHGTPTIRCVRKNPTEHLQSGESYCSCRLITGECEQK